jgi:hypothetical protein
MSAETGQPREVQDHEILDSFWHAGGSTGGIVRDCDRHGLTFFNEYEPGFFENGELEDLQAKAKENPEKYIALDHSVSQTTFLGVDYTWDCPKCRVEAVRVQAKVWGYRHQLSLYINERLKDELAAAVRDFKEQTINLSGEDGWQPIEAAPKNGTKIRALMHDGTRHHDVHWADGGGEDQPRYRGWFRPSRNDEDRFHFVGIDTPLAWKPKES